MYTHIYTGGWMPNILYMPDGALILTIEKDTNMISYLAWDRYYITSGVSEEAINRYRHRPNTSYNTNILTVKLLSSDVKLKSNSNSMYSDDVILCGIYRDSNDEQTANYRLYNLDNVALSISAHFS